MAKKIQLTIPEPCHENWDNMTPVEKGRFCGSCQKQVVDFSNMSDREVAQFFKKPSTGSVCGRFMQEQLNRDMEIPKKRIPWVKHFFQIALPAFLFSAKVSGQRMGSVKQITKKELDAFPAKKPDILLTKITGDTIVLNKEKKALPICFTQVMGDIVQTDLPEEKKEQQRKSSLEDTVALKEVIVIAMGGVKRKKPTGLTDIQSKPEAEMLNGLSGRLGGVIAGIKITKEDSIFRKVLNSIVPPKFIVYPNPVQRGQAITIETPSDKEKLIRVIVADLSGKQLVTLSHQMVKGMNRFAINTDSRWTAGVYIVHVEDEKGRVLQQQKLLIQ